MISPHLPSTFLLGRLITILCCMKLRWNRVKVKSMVLAVSHSRALRLPLGTLEGQRRGCAFYRILFRVKLAGVAYDPVISCEHLPSCFFVINLGFGWCRREETTTTSAANFRRPMKLGPALVGAFEHSNFEQVRSPNRKAQHRHILQPSCILPLRGYSGHKHGKNSLSNTFFWRPVQCFFYWFFTSLP